MKSKQQREIDKRKTAIHEAGHAVVALACGIASVRLNLKPSLEKRMLRLGSTRGWTVVRHQRSKVKSAAMGYAGVLAELFYDNFDANENDALESLELGKLVTSPADNKFTESLDPKWRPKALKLSVRLLKQHWVVVRGVAFELHSNQRGCITTSSLALAQKQWMGLL